MSDFDEEMPLDVMREKLRAASGKGPSRKKALREPVTSIKKVLSDRERKNSRVKGSTFELAVAKAWAKWSGEHVRRTPQSGGWSNAKFGVTADLVCDAKRFPFHVEIKHREGAYVEDLITGVRVTDTRSIHAWWQQTIRSCPKNKTPVLVWKRNHLKPLVMMWLTDWTLINAANDRLEATTPILCINIDDGELVMISQETFHAVVRYNKKMRMALKRNR